MKKKTIIKTITIVSVITIVCVGFVFKQMKVIQAYSEKENRIEERYQGSRNYQRTKDLSKTCEYGHTNCDGHCQNINSTSNQTCRNKENRCYIDHDHSQTCVGDYNQNMKSHHRSHH